MNNRETQIGREVRINKFADLYFICGFGTEYAYVRIVYSPASKMYQAYRVIEKNESESFTAITEASKSMRPVWAAVQKFQKNPY